MPLVCGVCFSAKQTVTIAPGGSSTAVHEEYSMWVMPMSTFVELDRLQPHQLLKQTGKLVQYDKSMSTIFFLSHQCVFRHCRPHLGELLTPSLTSIRWTGFKHPDQSLDQLRTMQRLFLRMMAGNVKGTEPDFESKVYLPKTKKVSARQWAALVPEAYIWMVRRK